MQKVVQKINNNDYLQVESGTIGSVSTATKIVIYCFFSGWCGHHACLKYGLQCTYLFSYFFVLIQKSYE